VHVATSFYSDDPATHERITHGKRSWNRTVDGIRAVLDAGLPLRVGVIETDQNIGHGGRAMDFVRGLGVKEVRIDRQRQVGRSEIVELGPKTEHFEELCGQCWKGRLCVTASGETYPCVFSRATPLGDVKLGLAQITQSSRLRAFRKIVKELEEGRSLNPQMCNPNEKCNPDFCNPNLPCHPQGPFCSPDSQCAPGTRCQPDK
jgi:MoaA/NifB/PqqE/SkfB family radical SAM enzyme